MLRECRQHAEDAEERRKDENRSAAAMVAAIVVALVWLLLAFTASGLMAAYIRHHRLP